MYGNLPKRRRKKIECHQRFLPKDAPINEKVESEPVLGSVPVDATALEIDYIDSGHIRIGIHQSSVIALNP